MTMAVRPPLSRRTTRHRRATDSPETMAGTKRIAKTGRCIERIGDNAVDIGEQTAFVVTGLFREFEDASHPVAAAPPTA